MARWNRVKDGPAEFVLHVFSCSGDKTIDLDGELLQRLIQLFVGTQLGFWRRINLLAQTRFPNRRVDRGDIQTVRRFIKDRPDEFVTLFTEHIPHYLMLRHRPSDFEPCTQKRPHLSPHDHYADHLAVWRTPVDSYQFMISETKASQWHPRDLVRKSPGNGERKHTMFDEFDDIEAGKHDLALKQQLLHDVDWSLLLTTKEEVEQLVETGFWKRDFVYHGCVVTRKSEARPSIFSGYDEVAARNPNSPERRWATVVPISDWEDWVSTIIAMSLDCLAELGRRGTSDA